jgi:hypothetical protein
MTEELRALALIRAVRDDDVDGVFALLDGPSLAEIDEELGKRRPDRYIANEGPGPVTLPGGDTEPGTAWLDDAAEAVAEQLPELSGLAMALARIAWFLAVQLAEAHGNDAAAADKLLDRLTHVFIKRMADKGEAEGQG